MAEQTPDNIITTQRNGQTIVALLLRSMSTLPLMSLHRD